VEVRRSCHSAKGDGLAVLHPRDEDLGAENLHFVDAGQIERIRRVRVVIEILIDRHNDDIGQAMRSDGRPGDTQCG
jgi:hypothetical protein